jgi:hypothetical protein
MITWDVIAIHDARDPGKRKLSLHPLSRKDHGIWHGRSLHRNVFWRIPRVSSRILA